MTITHSLLRFVYVYVVSMWVSMGEEEMVMRSVHITKTGAAFLGILSIILLYLSYKFSSGLWPSYDQTVDMQHLLAVSAQLAKLGGDRALSIHKEHQLGAVVKGKTKEGANEMLTRGDMESHRIMRFGLEKTFPGLKLVSEEHDEKNAPSGHIGPFTGLTGLELAKKAERILMRDVTVWIDPLDATQEYTESLLHYVTTMVCVAIKGKPTIGVIYRPFAHEIAWGYVGHGVSPNVQLWVEEAKPKLVWKRNGTKIIVSRSHAGDVRKVVQASLGEDANVEPAGGAGYKVLRVINGSIDAYVHTTRIKKWDVCAGNAILDAVGGQMTTLTGQSLDYSDTINPQNNDGLLATLVGHAKFLKIFSTAFKNQKSRAP